MPSKKTPSNLLCKANDLSNEASVENFFVDRLLTYLGYKDSHIKLKASLDELSVNKGRRKELYRPDYAIDVKGKVRWIIEAKGAEESIDSHLGQCEGYCLALNKRFPAGENPVQFFLITNGLKTELYRWDSDTPILTLAFQDFVAGSKKLEQLVEHVGRSQVIKQHNVISQGPALTLNRLTPEQLNSAFAWCHQFIYKKDNLQQSAAFMEFVKIIFLKLLSDREVRAKFPPPEGQAVVAPAHEVRFSKAWIESMQREHANPLDAIQFRQLLTTLDVEIAKRRKKRIFDSNDKLKLTPETIKGVVEKLESVDLFAVDADLNGRLFETFLNATMRGKDLGQFFTPRSVVKMALELANIAVFPSPEIVLDGCCGTGGFLIDSLAWMWKLVDDNASLTSTQKAKLRTKIATECIYGIDIAQDPPLARIARMNMYLHGDGGSRIYQADALDKKLAPNAADSVEIAGEKDELREIVSSPDGFVDVVITNPPFAKEYQSKFPRERKILGEYALATESFTTSKIATTLKSSLMFLERYCDMLRPGGRLVTVVDDSILGSSKYRAFRAYLRAKFIIRAVVSLPGDAFQRSNARVKTSIMVLQKKTEAVEAQPAVFMYYATAVGLDDPSRQRILPRDIQIRNKALGEVAEVRKLYGKFVAGTLKGDDHLVPASRLSDRLDVKSCLPKIGRQENQWKKAGLSVVRFGELVELVFPVEDEAAVVNAIKPADPDLVITSDSNEEVTFLRVRYDGGAEPGDTLPASASNYTVLRRIREDDIVISNINAVHGAVAVVPKELSGLVVSSEYTVCRATDAADARLLWMLLRSPQSRADLLLLATGIGRTRVVWSNISQLKLPLPSTPLADDVVRALKAAEAKEREAARLRGDTRAKLEDALGLADSSALDILDAFRPPK